MAYDTHTQMITPQEKLSNQQTEIKDRLAQISKISLAVLNENQTLLNQYVTGVKNKLKMFPDEEESLTFMEILKNEPFIERGFSQIFVKKYLEKFNNGEYPDASKYIKLTELINSRIATKNNSKSQSSSVLASLPGYYSSTTDTIFIASLGGQLYFPYSENFGSLLPGDFWTTSDPISDTTTSVTVLKYNGTRYVGKSVGGEWAETQATLVANLDDRILDPVPPPPVVLCSDLTANTVANLDDRYSISTGMPSIRLLENIRYGFFSGSNRIEIFQGYAKLTNPTVNQTSGTLAVTTPNRSVGTARIKRKEARNGKWKSFAPIWNPYWNVEQKDNYLVISYRKSFLSGTNTSINYNVSAGVVYDATKQEWVPSLTGTVTASGSISLGKNYAKYGEDWVPRASILTNAVGDIFGLGTTVTQNIYLPTPFTIRQVNKFQYYFKTNICF